MSWWVDLEYPPFEEGDGGFPRTGQVVKYYRENKRDDEGCVWTQTRLSSVLEISLKTVGEIEIRDSSLDFDRRQRLCEWLDVPPILLGIRTRQEILWEVLERRAKKGTSVISTAIDLPQCWWMELDYPAFAPGKDGIFPRTGQVVKHYREQKMDTKGKPWTQRRLANALGIETDQAVWNLENRDTVLDIERRRFLSDLFAIPPILLGIMTLEEIDKVVEQRRKAQSAIVVVSTPVSTSHKLLIDVEEYTALLNSYWKTFLCNPTQISMTNIFLCIDALDRELPHVREKKPIQELLCRFHDLVANVLCDQHKYNDALVHLEKASSFAGQLKSDELKTLVLYDYGYALWLTGRFDKALEKCEEARRYEQRLPRNLRDSLLLETGSTRALVAETPEEKDTAIDLVDLVGNSLRSKGIEEDPYFLSLDLDRYHLIRSESLIAVGRNRDAIEELKNVKAGPAYPRRQAYHDIYRAQAHTNLGEYSEAASFAASGLVIAQQVNSVKNITSVKRMYRKFPLGLFRHDDDVARLEYLLRKRKVRR